MSALLMIIVAASIAALAYPYLSSYALTQASKAA